MFDIGFWELAVIGVIALLVIGPERLPGVARNVGLWVGRTRRYVAHVRRDIERELHAEEVRALLETPDTLDGLKDVARETASIVEDTRRELNDATRGSPSGSAAPAGGGAKAEPAPARRVPHHAVDEDPFAPASIARVSPPADPAPAADAPAGGEPDPSDVTPSDEQPPERQGQR